MAQLSLYNLRDARKMGRGKSRFWAAVHQKSKNALARGLALSLAWLYALFLQVLFELRQFLRGDRLGVQVPENHSVFAAGNSPSQQDLIPWRRASGAARRFRCGYGTVVAAREERQGRGWGSPLRSVLTQQVGREGCLGRRRSRASGFAQLKVGAWEATEPGRTGVHATDHGCLRRTEL